MQNSGNLDALGNLAAEKRALDTLSADLQALNRECGQLATAYKRDNI